MSVAINCSFTIYFACYCIAIQGFELIYLMGLVEAFVFCGLGWTLTCTSVSNVMLLETISVVKDLQTETKYKIIYLTIHDLRKNRVLVGST